MGACEETGHGVAQTGRRGAGRCLFDHLAARRPRSSGTGHRGCLVWRGRCHGLGSRRLTLTLQSPVVVGTTTTPTDSITTDHIAPAGSVTADSSAGRYLIAHAVPHMACSSFGSLCGKREVMMRCTSENETSTSPNASVRLLQCVGPSLGSCSSASQSTRVPNLATGRTGARPGCSKAMCENELIS